MSQATPEEIGAGIDKINRWADEYGREIEDDHFGVLFSFCFADTAGEARRLAEPYMLRRRADVDFAAFSAFGTSDDVVDLIDRYVDQGAPKFVARPACPPEMMFDQLKILGREVVSRYPAPPVLKEQPHARQPG